MKIWQDSDFWGLVLIYLAPLIAGIHVGLGWLTLLAGLWIYLVMEHRGEHAFQRRPEMKETVVDRFIENHVFPLSFIFAIISSFLPVASAHTWKGWLFAAVVSLSGLGCLLYFYLREKGYFQFENLDSPDENTLLKLKVIVVVVLLALAVVIMKSVP